MSMATATFPDRTSTTTEPCRPPRARPRRVVLGIVCVGGLVLGSGPRPADAADVAPAVAFTEFLAERGIDRSARTDLERATSWQQAEQRLAIRVLLRLAAPADLWTGWRSTAVPLPGDAPPAIGDDLVMVRGRAVFVAPQTLDEEERALAGQESFDVVRIVPDAGGTAPPVDVIVLRAPKAWPRWRVIDEPAVAVGLPVGTGSTPRPAPAPADGTAWPSETAALLVAAPAIEFHPPTPLGSLGMDYALFDTVRDGGKLVPGDTDALYAMLAAVGGQGADEAAKPTDILPIIDPSQRWFEQHRGEPVTIVGVARKATRISVDEPWRRAQVGSDAYWELFVFVDTPLLEVDGREQESYPVVCLVRELPAGMPTGDQISEKVRVEGFAFKRYGYPLPTVEVLPATGDGESRGGRRETALVVGRRVDWRPLPPLGVANGFPTWLFLGIVAAVAALLVAGAWSGRREERLARARARQELPDRIDVPPGAG